MVNDRQKRTLGPQHNILLMPIALLIEYTNCLPKRQMSFALGKSKKMKQGNYAPSYKDDLINCRRCKYVIWRIAFFKGIWCDIIATN